RLQPQQQLAVLSQSIPRLPAETRTGRLARGRPDGAGVLASACRSMRLDPARRPVMRAPPQIQKTTQQKTEQKTQPRWAPQGFVPRLHVPRAVAPVSFALRCCVALHAEPGSNY